jgi:hypothetical protein
VAGSPVKCETAFWIIFPEFNLAITEWGVNSELPLTRSATPIDTASSECRPDASGPGHVNVLEASCIMIHQGRYGPAVSLFKAHKRL